MAGMLVVSAPSARLRPMFVAGLCLAAILAIPVDAAASVMEGEVSPDASVSGEAGGDESPTEIVASQLPSIEVHGDAGTYAWVLVGEPDSCARLAASGWIAAPDAAVPREMAIDTDGDGLARTLSGWGLPPAVDLSPPSVDAATGASCYLVLRYAEVSYDDDGGSGQGGGGFGGCGSGGGGGGDDCSGGGGDPSDDGDDCSGGGSDAGDDCSGGGDVGDCRVGHDREPSRSRGRSPTSRGIVTLAAIALLARRRARTA
jgi:hypothetical protein